MTASNCLYIITIALMMSACGLVAYAADDASSSASGSTALAPDGTPVVHKSLHKKKSTTSSTSATNSTTTAPVATATAPTTAGNVAYVPPPPVPPGNYTSAVPTVETGLPIARHSDINGLEGSAPMAPSGLANSTSYHSTLASSIPIPRDGATSTVSSYSSQNRPSTDNFVFADYKKPKNNYPWKVNIYTTTFYIGEGGSSISNTDNKASSFDANWVDSNHGSDNPNDRNGYASGSHASTVNPFYIALPFNDLVYPDKARRWLPDGWHRAPKDGKPVSACKDRWVEIKSEDGSGHICYAQWEDVGPLRYDHAEYVFGPERPDTFTRAGLDVSPAVADYLGLNSSKHPTTRWRFVDDEDVPPGAWLKYDEQAVIYEALHHKSLSSPSSLPIQSASEPIDDQSMDSNKKKVGAAKG